MFLGQIAMFDLHIRKRAARHNQHRVDASLRADVLVREPNYGALGVGDMAEQPAVKPEKWLHGSEKAIAAGIANHDAGGLRRYFDDIRV